MPPKRLELPNYTSATLSPTSHSTPHFCPVPLSVHTQAKTACEMCCPVTVEVYKETQPQKREQWTGPPQFTAMYEAWLPSTRAIPPFLSTSLHRPPRQHGPAPASPTTPPPERGDRSKALYLNNVTASADDDPWNEEKSERERERERDRARKRHPREHK